MRQSSLQERLRGISTLIRRWILEYPDRFFKLVQTFLRARFSNQVRHIRRLNKVRALEARYAGNEQTHQKIGKVT